MPLYLKDKMVSGISLGVPGTPGKSAYEAALEANPELGLTEEEFGQQMANLGTAASQEYVDQKLTENKEYVDQKISEIPTPDVSGQINTHNTDSEAHADIREMINNIPTPDVSGQIGEHNTAADAHADIREAVSNAQTAADNAASVASAAQSSANGKAPMYSYSTTDLTAGSSSLETGKLYFVYE